MSSIIAAATAKKLDVLLVGFGAVGTIYSLILQRSGRARVTVVARSNYDHTLKYGVHIKSGKYGDIKSWKPDRLCRTIEEAADQPYSHVLIATKNVPELVQTPELVRPILDSVKFPQPIYVTLQNGMNVEDTLYHALVAKGIKEPKIISCAVYIAANQLSDYSVEQGTFDRLNIGAFRYNDCTTMKNTAEEQAMLDDFNDAIKKGGGDSFVEVEIQRLKLSKNFWNVAFSSFATLTAYQIPALFRSPPKEGQSYSPYVFPQTADAVEEHAVGNVRAILHEMLALGRAMGFPDSKQGIQTAFVEQTIESTRKLHQPAEMNHKPSMMLDAENDRPIEVEVILGEIVRMAKKYKVSVPRIELLYGLLVVKQNQILRKLSESPKSKI